MLRVLILIGTRPNFIKVTQFKKIAQIKFPSVNIQLVHTGQHYDEKMADVFFSQFKMSPDYFLNIAPASPSSQIAEIMLKLDELIKTIGKPDLILVPGDVNSTLAGALFANKNQIKLGHIESGLRSFDRSMPEEYNRLIADELSDLFFVTEKSGEKHLLKEGKDKEKIHLVGNTMIDTMVAYEKEIDNASILKDLGIGTFPYVLMTMHRPATVDSPSALVKLIDLIDEVGKKYKVVFPVHPRTIKNAKQFGLFERLSSIKSLITTEPMDYFSFQKLIKSCTFILTDSGGIQEESTYRKKPCLTLRSNTERPITVEIGTNTLLPFDLERVKFYIHQIEQDTYKKGAIPAFWDGNTTERILKIISSV